MTSLPKLLFAASTALVLTGCCCCPCNCGGGGGGSSYQGGSSSGGGGGGGFLDGLVEDFASGLMEMVITEGLEAALGAELGGSVEFDAETGEFSFVTDDGERVDLDVESPSWPDAFPHVDRYPGSNVVAVLDASQTKAKMVAVVASTGDSQADVSKFYEAKMSTLGNYSRVQDGDSIVLQGELPDGRVLAMAIIEDDENGGSALTFVATPKKQDAAGTP